MAKREKVDGVDYEEDLDQIDFNNYKGMFFNDDPGQKYQDEVTGAHFEYHDMCRRLKRIQQQVQIEEISDSEAAPPTELEGEVKKPAKESGQAIHNIHNVLAINLPKESRNGAQALPQQGYGTVGAYVMPTNGKDIVKHRITEQRNFRQFSSQLEPPKKSYVPVKVVHGQPVNRSKSIDKSHPFGLSASTVSKPQTGVKKITDNKVSKPVPNASSNAKRGTFYDLYFYIQNLRSK